MAPMAKNGNSLFLGDRRHGEADAGIGAQHHHGQPVAIGPFAKLLRANIGFVLVIGGQQFYPLPEDQAAEVGDRHLDCFHRPGAVGVGVGARHVVDVAYDDFGRIGMRRNWPKQSDRGHRKAPTHCVPSFKSNMSDP